MSQSEVISYWSKNEVSLFFMKRESETKSYKLRTYQLTTEGFLIYADYPRRSLDILQWPPELFFFLGSQDSLDMAEFERSVDKKPQVSGIGKMRGRGVEPGTIVWGGGRLTKV